MRLLAAALVCALSTAINWEGRPLPDVLEEIELLARRLRRSELERLREDGILDDQAFEHGVDFVMRRGGGMAAIAAREPAARRLVTIIARARAAGVTIIADDMIEEKLRQSSCPDKFADVVESEMAKRIEAARRRKASHIDSEAWIGKNVVDRALDAFHRLSGWRPPVATASEAFCAAVADGDVEALELTIRQAVDIEYQCPVANGTESALYIASRLGHMDCIEVLLREGAAVNSPEGRSEFPGETALHAAQVSRSYLAVAVWGVVFLGGKSSKDIPKRKNVENEIS